MSEQAVKTTFEEELRAGRNVAFFTVGVSMRPLLRERETHVVISPLDRAEPTDILLYIRSNGAYVLHRCMRAEEEYYLMRGDNTFGFERIKKEQAIGKVTHIYRHGECFDTKNKKYRAYVHAWNIIYPARWLAFRARAAVRKILR